MRLTALLGWCTVIGTSLLAACGTSSRETPALTVTPDGGGPAAHAGSNTANGNDTDDGIDVGGDGGVQGGDKLPDQCAADTQTAQQVPVDLYLMVDSSGSMADETAGGTKKWDDVKAALASFVDDPASAGLGVALQFFPIIHAGVPGSCTSDASCGGGANSCARHACLSAVPTLKYCTNDADCGGTAGDCQEIGACSGFFGGGPCFDDNYCTILSTCEKPLTESYCINRDSCTAADYAAPKVTFGQLPAHANGLKAELTAHVVDGLTPTGPALQGAIDAATAQKTANPTHNVAIVLATDGFPTECGVSDIAGIANVAANGKTAGISTYVIGVFTQDEENDAKTNLNQIASKGGSGQAFVVNTQQNVSQGFLQALNTIRGAALPCDYTLPVPKSGTPDYSKVNVQYTSGSTQTTIFNVADASACDPNTGGWYYDVDPSKGTPTKVMVCPKTCDGFKADSQAKIDIVQGCTTIVK
jgi:hypothetical protein